MNFYRLEVFYAVARRLSYSRAAADLFISQPAVSKHVHALEKDLGVKLFQQIGNRIMLTDAGRIVYDYAQRVFSLTDEAKRSLAELESLERGFLRLGTCNTGIYLLPGAVARFRERHPRLECSLEVSHSQQVVERVLGYEVDLGVVGMAVVEPQLQVQHYIADELVLILSPRHALARKERLSPQDLEGETFLWREVGSGTRKVMEDGLVRLGVEVGRSLELNGIEAVKRGVAAGLGISFVSRYAIRNELQAGELVITGGPELRFGRQLYIIFHKDIRQSASALAFSSFLRKMPLPQPGNPGARD
ncbi:MAG: LysR family transcriptional regulator [Chloroflexi bacterium]|nr:LysR family transcriptional regulator [Chloroflexota bacterium]